jgi:uncharacterized protein YndB with AHSA1/START domain
MRYETSTTSSADPARLWAVVSDVEKWPEWIETYEELRRTGSGDLKVGDRAHIKQKGLAAGDWTVTEVERGREFRWESRQPGVRILGWHRVTEELGGGSRLTLGIELTGWASGLASLMLGRKTRKYVDLELERLTTVAAQPATA